MSGAVRELATSVKFKLDNSSVARAENAIQNLKRNLERLNSGNTISTPFRNMQNDITRASASVRRLQTQLNSLRSSGGEINIRSNISHGATPTGSNAGLLNAIRNIRVAHADRVFVKGNISGNNNRGAGSPGGSGGGGGGGHDPDNGGGTRGGIIRNGGGGSGGGRLQAFTDRSGDMMMTGAAITAPIGFAIKQAIDFESVMADVNKVLDLDPDGLKKIRKDIQNLSREIPMTQEGLASIVAAAGQAGIDGNLVDFAKDAAKMGIAFDITAEEAGETMAKWRTAFGMSQESVLELADKVNFLGNKTTASAPKITEVLNRVGALGKVAGMAEGDLAALGATMLNSSPPEVAATGVQNLLLALSAGESATKSQAAAFAQLGFDTKALAERMQGDAKGAIMDVFTALSKLPEAERAAVLTDAFGKESIKSIAPLLTSLDTLEKNFGLVTDANRTGENGWGGSMEGEYNARAATTENSLQLLENNFNVIGTNLGGSLLPVINQLVEGFMPLVESIANFVENNQELVGVILAVAGAAGVLLTGLGAVGILISGLTGLAPIFSAIGGVISGAFGGLVGIFTGIGGTIATAFSAFLSGGLSAALGVVGTSLAGVAAAAAPVVAIIAAIGSVIYYVYEHWDELKNYFMYAGD